VRRSFAMVAAIVAVGLPAIARADDRAAAQQLFDEGKQLVAQGKLAEACPRFEASARLSQTPGVRLNLVDCWTTLGRTASAWVMAAEAQRLAQQTGDDAAAAAAGERRAALQKRLTYLTVTVAGGTGVAGLEILRDGEKVVPAEWGLAVPVDPGRHEIVAHAPGRKPWSTTQTLTEPGATVTVTIPELPDEATEGTSGGMSTGRVLAIATAGVGVVGLGVGTYFAFDAISKKNTYLAHEGAGGQCADPTCQSASHDAFNSGTWSTVGFAVGGALCALGAVMWLYWPGTSTGVSPSVGPQSAGLELRGGW
jgi:hypothetical protein